MQASTLIFLHIPKAAGTTLHRIIEQQYRPRQIYSMYPTLFQPKPGIDGLMSLSPSRRAHLRVVKGHLFYGIHRVLPRPTTYFTLLRDPVDRVISFYYFIRTNPEHYLHEFSLEPGVSLHTFIEAQATRAVNNFQTRMIAGEKYYPVEFGKCRSEMLVEAKRNLRQRFAVVGLSERFDETLLLLKRAFRWRHVFYTRQNITPRRARKHELPPATLDLIRAQNALDIELYEYAQELFRAEVEAQGPAFVEDVRRLQLRNQQVQPLVDLYWGAKKVSVRASFYKLWRRLRNGKGEDHEQHN